MSDHTGPADRGLGEIAEHDRRLAAQESLAAEQARAAEAMEDSQRRLYERVGGII